MGRHGFNINAQGIGDDEVLKLVQGKTASVIRNNPDLAERIAKQVPGYVISRPDDTGFDDTDQFPAGLVGKWRDDSYHNIWYYWPNEPNPSNIDDFMARACSFLEVVGDARVKVCFGNFAPPAILSNVQDLHDGKWDELLKAMSSLSEAGLLILGIHEYSEGLLPYGCAAMNQKEMQKEQDLSQGWPTWQDIVNAGDNNWHLFKFVPLWIRCNYLGIPMPKTVVTECFWDADEAEEGLQDLYAQFNHWLGGEHPRGIINQRNLFHYWFPSNVSTLEAAVRQLQWVENTYPSFVKGFCHFTYDTVDPNWKLYDYSQYPDLVNAMVNI